MDYVESFETIVQTIADMRRRIIILEATVEQLTDAVGDLERIDHASLAELAARNQRFVLTVE